MSKDKNEQSITFKALATIFQAFNGEKELNPQQINVMRHTQNLLNTMDRKGSCNYDQPYTLAEQGESKKNETTVTMALYEKVLNENETLKAEVNDLHITQEDRFENWKSDFVSESDGWKAKVKKGYAKEFEQWKYDYEADLIKAKNNLSELDVKEDAIVKLQDENEKLIADKKTLNERLTKVAVKRDELELALQEQNIIRVDLEDRIEDLKADNETFATANRRYVVKEEAIGETPIAVKTTSELNKHTIKIYKDNTVSVVSKDIEDTLQHGTLTFNEHLSNSTILEYCENNVV